MIKRIVCSLAALMVLTSSVFSWDAYSFTGVYDIASASAPVLYSTTSDSSSDSSNLIDLMQYTGWTGFDQCWIRAYGDSVSGLPNLNFQDRIVSGQRVNLVGRPYVAFSGETNFYSSIFVPTSIRFPYYEPLVNSNWGPSFVYEFSEPYPVSVSLDGLIRPYLSVGGDDPVDYFATSLSIRINDSNLVQFEFSGKGISISHIFTDYSGIKTISFFPHFNPYVVKTNRDISYNFAVFLTILGDELKMGILDGNSALNGFNSEAQDSINDHESIESEWTGSMTTNFDALDMDNFTFPSGLVSGFGLITGIFQDLWNAMGEYKILFVFPLTLGVALLLIGRISKFSGGQSSSRSNRGDDGA